MWISSIKQNTPNQNVIECVNISYCIVKICLSHWEPAKYVCAIDNYTPWASCRCVMCTVVSSSNRIESDRIEWNGIECMRLMRKIYFKVSLCCHLHRCHRYSRWRHRVCCYCCRLCHHQHTRRPNKYEI